MAGTVPVTIPDGGFLDPTALGRLGDGALVLTRSGGLWSSDGSPEGNSRFIAQLPFNPNHPERFKPVFAPVALGASTFVFRRAPGPGGPATAVLEIWRTDGTAAGTLRLASTPFLDNYSSELSPAVVGGRLFFRFGGTIWTSDGSVEGTYPLPRSCRAVPSPWPPAAARSTPPPATRTPTRSTRRSGRSIPSTLTASLAGNLPSGRAPAASARASAACWATPSSSASTTRRDPQRSRQSGPPRAPRRAPARCRTPLSSLTAAAFFTAGDRRYFTACEAEHGCELWSADRLGETPQLVADLSPGPRGSDPEILAVDGTSILFAATEPATGRELWRLDLTAASPSSAVRVLESPKRLVSPRLSPDREPARKRSGPRKRL